MVLAYLSSCKISAVNSMGPRKTAPPQKLCANLQIQLRSPKPQDLSTDGDQEIFLAASNYATRTGPKPVTTKQKATSLHTVAWGPGTMCPISHFKQAGRISSTLMTPHHPKQAPSGALLGPDYEADGAGRSEVGQATGAQRARVCQRRAGEPVVHPGRGLPLHREHAGRESCVDLAVGWPHPVGFTQRPLEGDVR